MGGLFDKWAKNPNLKFVLGVGGVGYKGIFLTKNPNLKKIK